MTRLRIRRSTAALCGFFLLTLAVYLLVRPNPAARPSGAPAHVSPSRPVPTAPAVSPSPAARPGRTPSPPGSAPSGTPAPTPSGTPTPSAPVPTPTPTPTATQSPVS